MGGSWSMITPCRRQKSRKCIWHPPLAADTALILAAQLGLGVLAVRFHLELDKQFYSFLKRLGF